jgi:plastocyanin
MLVRASLTLLFTLAACSDSSSSTPDAASPGADAAAATVKAVTCPATPAASVTATDGTDTTYSPKMVTISLGQIVKFTMPSTHNVVPNPTMSDPGLVVNFNATTCLMFTQTGTFGFHCGPHSFVGTVTVQ